MTFASASKADSRSPRSSTRRAPTTTRTPSGPHCRTSGRITSSINWRACRGDRVSSSASTIRLNRAGRRASLPRRAGIRSIGVAGSPTAAARAISTAISSAVLPLACTAQETDPTVARTASSPGGSSRWIRASAVVTIRPSTADLPTPGEPVTTSGRASGPRWSSHSTIWRSATARPRNRDPRSESAATPRARGSQCRRASSSFVSSQPQAAKAASSASSTCHSARADSFISGRCRSTWKSVSAWPSPALGPSCQAETTKPTTAAYSGDQSPAPLKPRARPRPDWPASSIRP
jgi:hypothetical protein